MRRTRNIVGVSLLVVLAFAASFSVPSALHKKIVKTPVAPTPIAKTHLSSAPRKIFLDLGANCGNSYLLFQKANSHAKTVITPEYTCYLFEAQPSLFERWLKPLQSSVGDNMHVFNVAVATSAGSVLFGIDSIYPSDTCGDMERGEGYPHGASSVYSEMSPSPHMVNVSTIDLAEFLQGLDLRPDDFVVMKIDIEAQEFVILRHLIQRGLLCLIDELYVEWHSMPKAVSETVTTEMFKNTFEFIAMQPGCVGYYQPWGI